MTLWKKPFIKDATGYLQMDPSVSAPAFYEVLANALRDLATFYVDHEIGFAIERLVRAELAAHNVPSITGKYELDGVQYECDLLVETPEQILLFETKKKVLRRSSKGGDSVALLADVADSLFAAQVQAARHELTLYRSGQIVLDDGERKHTVVRGKRGVERIALTHLDYGSLQDRQVLKMTFDIMAGATVSSSDAAAQAQLRKLEQKGKQLATYRANCRIGER